MLTQGLLIMTPLKVIFLFHKYQIFSFKKHNSIEEPSAFQSHISGLFGRNF